MKLIPRSFFLLVCVLVAFGMSRKPSSVSIRIHAEANAQDSAKFALPVTLTNPPRQTYIEKIPSISERYVRAVFPFQAPDGSWGCALKLDEKGRIDLEVLSTERRGSSLVIIIATKFGVRQIADLVVDRVVNDGIISIPRGLTEDEIGAFTSQFPVLGKSRKK